MMPTDSDARAAALARYEDAARRALETSDHPSLAPDALARQDDIDHAVESILVAAFPSRIELADLHSEDVAALARMTFDERWVRLGQLIVAQMQVEGLETPRTEDDILDAGVSAANRARRRESL